MKSFSFTNPWYLLIAVPLIALTIIPFLRLSKKRRTKKHIATMALRCVAIILICAMLSGMTSISTSDDVSVIILADLSDSNEAQIEEMEEFISDFIQSADSNVQVGVVAFADGCLYEAELSDDLEFTSFTSEPITSATDIEQALRYAASVLYTDNCERIILLSDGMQTQGDAEAAAAEIAYQQIRIDTVLFGGESGTSAEVQINDIEIPSDAYAGDAFDIDITVRSNVETTGTLTVYDNGSAIYEAQVEINEGVTAYSLEATAASSGVHTFMAQITPSSDSITQNNTYYSYIKILGDPNILIVEGVSGESSALTALLEDEYSITAVSAGSAPSTLTELISYDEIILMNVSADDLPEGFDTAVEQYISVLGRGVLTTGGTNTYYYGSMEDTAFEDFLPVSVTLDDDEEATGTTALIILIDSSSSMEGTFLELAKTGAINSVNALSDTDYIGIISFCDTAHVISELTSMENKDEVIEAISEIEFTRGTYLYAATKEAYSQLKESDADTKHVIILSDGNPRDSGYADVIAEMYASNITTSTILIGTSATSTIMQQLAELGGGDFYYVSDVSDLPDVMVQETEQHAVSYIVEGTFTPEINTISQVLSGVDSIPSLDGYITTKLKSTASSVLYTDANKPIYAEWDYGNGHVASFTSDLSGTWSSAFMSSEEGITFIKNAVSSLITSEDEMTGLDSEITLDGTDAEIVVTADNYTDGTQITATVIAPDSTESTVTLAGLGEGTFTGQTEALSEGVYTVLIMQYDSAGSVVSYTTTAFASSYSLEYDAFLTGGSALLESISSLSGGELMDSIYDLLGVDMETAETENSLFIPLGILAALLLISDLVMRNAKWKDLVKLFVRKTDA